MSIVVYRVARFASGNATRRNLNRSKTCRTVVSRRLRMDDRMCAHRRAVCVVMVRCATPSWCISVRYSARTHSAVGLSGLWQGSRRQRVGATCRRWDGGCAPSCGFRLRMDDRRSAHSSALRAVMVRSGRCSCRISARYSARTHCAVGKDADDVALLVRRSALRCSRRSRSMIEYAGSSIIRTTPI